MNTSNQFMKASVLSADSTSTSAPASRSIPKGWIHNDIPDQSGRTVLVTGANSGLGFLTSIHLAQRGAHVIMTVRNLAKGRDAITRIEASHPKGSIELRLLDLADLDQVKAFADKLINEGTAIDVLVNNAGIMMPPHTFTAQGHELQFGVNHLAHFVLTGILLPRIMESHQGRIVTIASDLHKRGKIHFDDLKGQRNYGRISFYAQSKFANVLFALELDRYLKAAGSSVKSVLAHPGYAATNLQLSGPSGLLKIFMHIGNRFMAQPAEMGVLPQLFAATAQGVESGDFIGPDGPNEKKGYPSLVKPLAAACDEQLAQQFWKLSVELTGIDPAIQFAKAQPASTKK